MAAMASFIQQFTTHVLLHAKSSEKSCDLPKTFKFLSKTFAFCRNLNKK